MNLAAPTYCIQGQARSNVRSQLGCCRHVFFVCLWNYLFELLFGRDLYMWGYLLAFSSLSPVYSDISYICKPFKSNKKHDLSGLFYRHILWHMDKASNKYLDTHNQNHGQTYRHNYIYTYTEMYELIADRFLDHSKFIPAVLFQKLYELWKGLHGLGSQVG